MLNLARSCNSPDRSTKSTRLNFKVLPQLVDTGFQVLFHSPPGVLFTFPSLYCSSIGHLVVFRLGGGSPRLPTRFHVSRGTSDSARSLKISVTGLSPSMAGFPNAVLLSARSLVAVHNPGTHALRFRLFPFRSPLLWKSSFLSFPRPT